MAGITTGFGFGLQTVTADVSETLHAAAPPRPGTCEVAYSIDLFNIFFEFWDDFDRVGNPEILKSRFKFYVRLVADGAAFHQFSPSKSRHRPEKSAP